MIPIALTAQYGVKSKPRASGDDPSNVAASPGLTS